MGSGMCEEYWHNVLCPKLTTWILHLFMQDATQSALGDLDVEDRLLRHFHELRAFSAANP